MKKSENIAEAVERTLELSENIQQVAPSPFLKAKILDAVANESAAKPILLRPQFMIGLAAGVAIVLVNVLSILQVQKSNTTTVSADPYSMVSSQYQLDANESNTLYVQ